MNVPVVVVGFTRPDHIRATLEAIRVAQPREVFLLADGPRSGHPTDAERTAATRAVMDTVDTWGCTVHKRYSDRNLSVDGNIELGLDWVFSQVDRAIIIEDDCLADPTFFRFCEELLDRYQDDQRVWQIAGNMHGVPRGLFGEDSYRFAAWASIWGWATWADRWQRHREIFPRDFEGPDGRIPFRTASADAQPGRLTTRGGAAHFAEQATSVDYIHHPWDKQWWLTMISQGGIAAIPSRNMVANDGFGSVGATSALYERKMDPREPMDFPLRHPDEVVVDREIERELELLLARIDSRATTIARKVITNPTLRKGARRMLHSKAAVWALRAGSRVIDRGPR